MLHTSLNGKCSTFFFYGTLSFTVYDRLFCELFLLYHFRFFPPILIKTKVNLKYNSPLMTVYLGT